MKKQKPAVEVNFDGIIGPSHNYAGLSLGNLASSRNADAVSRPRASALQGLAKMRCLMGLGVPQGFLLPHDRPAVTWLRTLGFSGTDEDVCAAAWAQEPGLMRNAMSASAMWTANAATVSPAPDTADGRCHLSIANLSTMMHRSIEPAQTLRQIKLAFADRRFFAVHDPLPPSLGDEGAANFMRLAPSHGEAGLEIFVYGEAEPGGFPARQHRAASAAVARRHLLQDDAAILARQNPAAINAGAFHNDVVAVANEQVLFYHDQAFHDTAPLLETISRYMPDAIFIAAPADRIPLVAAVRSYLFNSQLVTLPGGGMALIVPAEVEEDDAVWTWVLEVVAGNNPIAHVEVVDVRESMRNGGGPACLRLRAALDDNALRGVDQRFMLDDRKADLLGEIITAHWPERLEPADLGSRETWEQCREALAALRTGLGFAEGEL